MGCEDAQYKTQAAGTVANCVTAYDQDGRTTSVVEDNAAGTAVHTTTYGYDADFNQTAMTHDWAPLTYRYNTLEKLPAGVGGEVRH